MTVRLRDSATARLPDVQGDGYRSTLRAALDAHPDGWLAGVEILGGPHYPGTYVEATDCSASVYARGGGGGGGEGGKGGGGDGGGGGGGSGGGGSGGGGGGMRHIVDEEVSMPVCVTSHSHISTQKQI
jgi:hypothetical protein